MRGCRRQAASPPLPELPDIEVYLDALRRHVVGRRLRGYRSGNPFVLRTVTPAPSEAVGRDLASVSRIGKRIVFEFDGSLWFVIHLMIAGRLRWRKPGAALPGRRGLAALDFDNGTLLLTEEGRKKRASLHVVGSPEILESLDPGGVEVTDLGAGQYASVLRRDNRTLKRALTDPHIFSGIGNAYSDEILHHARMSPFRRTRQLSDEEVETLRRSTLFVLSDWTGRLRREVGDGFPEKVTAFRDGMAVHGRYGEPCPVCGAPVQRIVYVENEANYCASCQTGGKVLADRSLSRLLKEDWPGTLEELEALNERRRGAR